MRFNDPAAEQSAGLVHTVEISEPGDPRQYLTFWLKGRGLAAYAWAKSHGLRDYHKTELYHTGTGNYGWMPGVYPDKASQGWSHHYHLETGNLPGIEDFLPFTDEIPTTLADVVIEYLRNRQCPV